MGRIIVVTKSDLVPKDVTREWVRKGLDVWKGYEGDENQRKQKLKSRGLRGGEEGKKTAVVVVDLKKDNTRSLKKQIFQLGSYVNERRERRGIKGRPIRVGVVGYPNTGKSTLINKLVGKKRCKAENQPGVTRGLTWVKVKTTEKKGKSLASGIAGGEMVKSKGGVDEFELLDTPGIIPKKLDNHLHAHMLAACNAVGRKGYDGQRVAGWLLGWLGEMGRTEKSGGGKILDDAGPNVEGFMRKTYEIEVGGIESGELALHEAADNKCKGDLENAANKVLQDFRSGRMGKVALQVEEMERVMEGAEEEVKDEGWDVWEEEDFEEDEIDFVDLKAAREEAEREGLEMPDVVMEGKKEKEEGGGGGGGAFEGW